MKAVVYEKYGSPDVLELKEVDKPTCRDDEVLVKVYAASINAWDWERLRGKPYEYRLISGILRPKKINILGCDIAGRVEEVGNNVQQFKPGDEVYGDLSRGSWGGFAEYVCARESEVTHKPSELSFEEAAATPQAALLALQALQIKKEVNKGDHILINGGCGGAGTFAIQLAKAFGYEITAVDSTEKLDMMRSLGADHVIDYRKEDFTRNGRCYDLILDVRSTHSIFDYKGALHAQGMYASVGGNTSSIIQLVFLGPLIRKKENKVLMVVMHKANQGLSMMNELFKFGKVKPVVDKCFPLNETAEAFRYFGEGHFKGKVVVTLDTN
ncbi:MAG: NAD(P)-dependent alcohol dehydrogenase [Candidatus Electrothrix sp. AR5]|nr:NAD(P)-dependent alcohol dehydrogenase [Candidatus Electrothrix sp. AR5]